MEASAAAVHSPVERYVIRGGRAGYERLKVLARLPARDRRASRSGRRRPGRALPRPRLRQRRRHLRARAPSRAGGHVTGVDLDEVKLALAREDGRARASRTPSSGGNVYEWGEPAASTSSTAATCSSISAVRSTSCAACGRACGPAARSPPRTPISLAPFCEPAERRARLLRACLFACARAPRRRPADGAEALPPFPRGRHPRPAPDASCRACTRRRRQGAPAA